MNVNKSSYYYWLNTKNEHDNKYINFLQSVLQIYSDSNGIYGAPKITAILNKNSINCSISTVSRAMHTIGIMSIVPKKFHRKPSALRNQERNLIINLIKDLVINRINQVWTTDITYIKTINEGTFYLISYIDLYSRKVISWDLFENQKTDKIILVLKKAIQKRKPLPGLIAHSDKGSQFRSGLYRQFLQSHYIAFSYTSLGHSCDENAAQESFHASLKKECLYQKKIYTKEDAYREIYNYIEGFYNPIRVHSSLGYFSPDEFKKT